MTNLRAQSPIIGASIGGTSVAGSSGAFIQHLSCDGLTYNGVANTMKVFAWDDNGVGASQGWTFDDGFGVSLSHAYNVLTGIGIYSPEIALVSKDYGSGNVAIFAVIVYYIETSPTVYEAYMDVQLWNGTSFGLYNSVAIPNSTTAVRKTINVAGDEYGHFVIVYGKGNKDYTSTSIMQWVGYINSPTTLQMGNAGFITRNNYDMSEPDADVTFDNNVNIAPFDGNVFLTFVTKQGYTIMGAAIQFRDLFPGGTWDIMTNNNDLAQVPHNCITSHPSVSVNDGYQAFLGGYIPHASVAYQDECTNSGPTTESVYLFGIHRSTYALSSILLPTPVIPGVFNRDPTVVTSPIDLFTVAAWNYTNGSTLDGLAHTSTYSLLTNSFDPTYSGDMQVQLGGGSTKLTTASGFSQTEMMYFYYDNGGLGTLEYKIMPYSSTALRKADGETTDALTIYPNPVTSFITIYAKDNLATTILTDATGRIINTIEGDSRVLENTLNKNVLTLPSGLYFLKSTADDGKVTTVKFLKQ